MPLAVNRELVAAVGQRIQRLRLAAGLTQEQLAERVGIQPVSLSRIETGAKPGSISAYAAIASSLGITVSELMDVDVDHEEAEHSPEVEALKRTVEAMTPEQVELAARVVRELIK